MRNLLKMSLAVLLISVFSISCKNGEEKKEATVDTAKSTVDSSSILKPIDTTKKIKTDSAPIIPPKH